MSEKAKVKDVKYPSFPEASAPSPDVPIAHSVGSHGHHRSSKVFIAARANGKEPGFLHSLLKLSIFHWLNSVFGTIAFVVIAVGTIVSIVLLPLCCAGAFVFRFVLYLVGFLAEADVALYNFITPPEERVYVGFPREKLSGSGERVSEKLFKFSPMSLAAAGYFATIRFGLGLVSSVVLSFTYSYPLGVLTSHDESVKLNGVVHVIWFVVLTLCLFIAGNWLMTLAARLSRIATHHFCVERFSSYNYVNAGHHGSSYPAAVPSYGTNDHV